LFSTDGVHIGWHNCPAQWRSFFAGKEKVPTIAYNVTANHRRFIHGVTAGHPGTRNDKTISWFDKLIQDVRTDPFYKNLQFRLMDKDGQLNVHVGGWVLCDGGYHRWREMQCPLKPTELSDLDELAWSKRAESVRKDIECTFGILKGRFRILKLPVYYHSNSKNAVHGKRKVDNVFFTCCMLHNMLLQWDGLMDWEADVDWSRADGLWDEGTLFADTPDIDFSSMEPDHCAVPPEECEVETGPDGWADLRGKLVTHFAHPEARKTMTWNTLKMRFQNHGV
jgi:hypothetical protein